MQDTVIEPGAGRALAAAWTRLRAVPEASTAAEPVAEPVTRSVGTPQEPAMAAPEPLIAPAPASAPAPVAGSGQDAGAPVQPEPQPETVAAVVPPRPATSA